MPAQAPETAAAAIFAFFRDFGAALALRRSFYAMAVADAGSWRRAAVVVIFAALASDSMELYSDLDQFLVRVLLNWSFLPIMTLALVRWSVGTSVAWGIAQILGHRIGFGDLLRPSGYAYAPVALHLLPALLYWLDLAPVTWGLVTAVYWVVLPWVLIALTRAARAAGVQSGPASVVVAVTLFVSANLFDVLLDLILAIFTGGLAPSSVPRDGLAAAAGFLG